jgi:hypothetical protein
MVPSRWEDMLIVFEQRFSVEEYWDIIVRSEFYFLVCALRLTWKPKYSVAQREYYSVIV